MDKLGINWREDCAEACKNMYDKGMSCDDIANILYITGDDIKKLLF